MVEGTEGVAVVGELRFLHKTVQGNILFMEGGVKHLLEIPQEKLQRVSITVSADAQTFSYRLISVSSLSVSP